jgi:hypothetical protein
MENRAFRSVNGKTLPIQFDADFNRSCFYPSHVVVRDVKCFPVNQTKTKRLERRRVHAVSKIASRYHGVILSFPGRPFNKVSPLATASFGAVDSKLALTNALWIIRS